MNPRQFYDKVCELRAAQKEYFKTRNKTALSTSKKLEAEIDAEIERVNAYLARQKPVQGDLFGEVQS